MYKVNKSSILTTCLISIIIIFFSSCGLNNLNKSEIKVTKITPTGTQPSLYFKRETWGLTGDQEITVLSLSDEKRIIPDSTSEYVYRGGTIFYKFQNGVLYIYTPDTASVPQRFTTSFKIIQNQLENRDVMNLLENENYKRQDLIKID